MKRRFGILSIILLLLIVSTAYATTDSTTSSTSSTSSSTSSTSDSTTEVDDAALVYVSNVTVTPEVFFPGDEGTIAVTLTNSGTSAIGLSHPDIISTKLNVVEDNSNEWDTMSYIGADSTMLYSFVVNTAATDGTYYALFTVGTKSGNAIHYPVKFKVDSNSIVAAITDKPTSFSPQDTDNVTLSIMNVRDGQIKNVVISTEGAGVEVNPTKTFISTIDANSNVDTTFGITATQSSNVTFHISYQNGDNTHTQEVVLPVTVAENKAAAVPVVNNVAVTSSGSTYDVTGDVTNAGVTDATGVVVTVGSPAKGAGTYPQYAIGSIASDDSGSFEVTFTCNDLSSVPLVISWKDEDGDTYSVTKTFDLTTTSGSGSSTSSSSSGTSSGSSMSGGPGEMNGGMSGGPGGSSSTSSTSLFTSSKGGGISSFYLPIAAGVIAVVGIVLWTKRKWILAKVKKQQ